MIGPVLLRYECVIPLRMGPKRAQDAASGVHLKLNLAHGLVIVGVKVDC
ncbi:MAG: hypothetical protein AAFW60_02040 [Pseudomonadota bacterium]